MAKMPSDDPLYGMTQEDLDAIAGRIVSLRNEVLHVKQSDFAKLIGISQTYLSLIENGKKPVHINVLLRIASTFDVNIEWLLYGDQADKVLRNKKANTQYLINKLREESLQSLQSAYSLNDRDADFIRWFVALSGKDRSSFISGFENIRKPVY